MSPWWRDGVLYQVYPLSFKDSNADGHGDLLGVVSTLDYLCWLGVDGIWLNPFFRSPMVDFGYDISDHCAVDGRFGDQADVEVLIREAHARGLRIVLDLVLNHTSDEHPWFAESRSSRRSPRRDWYVWRPPAADGGPPNNWKSAFGGPAWTFDPHSGEYYLHTFHRRQPDLNWRNPAIERAMWEVVRFWLDAGVDGFRLDAIHHIGKHPQLPDNPPREPSARPDTAYRLLGEFDSVLHRYDKNDPLVHDVLRRFRNLLDTHRPASADAVLTEPGHRLSVGEVHLFDWPDWPQHWAGYYGAELDELHMPLNLLLVSAPWSAEAIRSAISTVESCLPRSAWPNWALGNHDESRVASRYGQPQARAGMLLLLTLRGTPLIYYGDELGLPDTPLAAGQIRDPWGHRQPALGRDPQRCPMPWTSDPHGGFCPPGIQPWLPAHPAAPELSVANQRDRPDSMLTLTRRLIALRRHRPELTSGSLDWVEAGAATDVLVYRRTHRDNRSYVLVNFGAQPATVRLPETITVAVSTVARSAASQGRRAQVQLEPFEAVLGLSITSPAANDGT
ncbi:alpha-amylase family glycosyl hydrolase [Allokutzneria sp. A3M-2-11 16]|uniref:alpha-amylase family glycosyl hydrolase n=1 Tax=Allokutzneria sp. A3M-2-11 16 TaxID=2962043 RepID=UPI0020B8203F|nr:alpha-amylase family glycosyl hydrolase [Allokutzneria sp. A3M-2-11 16]MCP3803237.1 alpha-amylase family glycosyl hydrolase [Allokutzneria sp. A3M-2-11 16]